MNWQALVDVLPEAVVVVTADGVITYLNAAASVLTGYARGDAQGASVTLLVPPEERRRVNVVAWLARWGEQPEPLQWRYLHLTGRTRAGHDLRLAVRVAKLLDDGVVHYAITLRDVGEELRNLADLRHQYLVTSRLLALSEDGVLMLNAQLEITYANPAMERLFGYPERALLGKRLSELLPLRYRDGHDAHVQRFEAGTAPSRLMGERGEVVGLHRDGLEIPLEASITKLSIPGASIEGERVFAAQLRDIRARKAAEASLLASERRFRAIFEHAMEAMVLLQLDGEVLEINAAAATLLGRERGEATGAFWDLPWWPQLQASGQDPAALEEARQRLRDAVARAGAGETVRANVQLTDVLGRNHRIDFSIVPATDALGVPQYLIAEGRDLPSDLPDARRVAH